MASKVHQSSLTKFLMQVHTIKNFVKENVDQVVDGKLWSCKWAFSRRHLHWKAL